MNLLTIDHHLIPVGPDNDLEHIHPPVFWYVQVRRKEIQFEHIDPAPNHNAHRFARAHHRSSLGYLLSRSISCPAPL
jgi:hypothetical protein